MQQRHFRGWCGIPVTADLGQSPSAGDMADALPLSLRTDDDAQPSESLPSPRYFDELFDLDLEFEKYEKIETPDFTNGRKGRFVHDFGRVRCVGFTCHVRRCQLLSTADKRADSWSDT